MEKKETTDYTPKDKAATLIAMYISHVNPGTTADVKQIQEEMLKNAKACATILVNEILESFKVSIPDHQVTFWDEVKEELKKL